MISIFLLNEKGGMNMPTDLKTVDLDENTILKKCVGCGTEFVVFVEMKDVKAFCSNACEEAHSIFNIPKE